MSSTFDRPVVESLFASQGDRIRLSGSHCAGCNANYFPQVAGCGNPKCLGGILTSIELPDQGTLYSFTWQEYQPPGLYQIDDWQPYALGLVELEPGLRVLGRIDMPRDQLVIDMVLQLKGRRLFQDDSGQSFGTYVFVTPGEQS